MSAGYRRVVTALDEQGRSSVIFDDRLSAPDGGTVIAWSTALPVSNEGTADTGNVPPSMDLLRGGTGFSIARMEPGSSFPMHASNTIDYMFFLSGRITLILETGEVELGAGDLVVDRGILHGWRVEGAEPVIFVCVNVGAEPVGAGATI